jgi:hypothetical protein
MALWKSIPQGELDQVRCNISHLGASSPLVWQVQKRFEQTLGCKYPITKADAFELRKSTPPVAM